jgi:formamidopyrimidine-DNA glycosylase
MPELPDLTVYLESLETRIANRRLLRVRASLHLVQGEAALEAMDPGGLEVFDLDLGAFSLQLKKENRTSQLKPEDVSRLYDATKTTLQDWITRLRTEAKGEFREGMAVHGRYGKPCTVCGAPVQRIRYAENETNYCARCQTGGKLLADRSLSRLLKKSWPRSIDEME